MSPLGSTFRLAPRLDRRPVARLERVLSVGRAFLTVTALAAIYLDPTEPARLATITYSVLLAYAVYSLSVLAYVHRASRLGAVQGGVLHGLDILWAAGLTFVSEGPVSPFFLFFLFVVLAAAYRWGLVGTIATAGITVAVFLVETAIAAAGPWSQTWLASNDFTLNSTILRVAYLLLTGFLLGYLAQQEKNSRAELAAIAEATRQPRVELGLSGSITTVARSLLDTFGARTVNFVLRDHETREMFLWIVDGTTAATAPARRIEIPAAQQAAWLFPDAGKAWHALLLPNGASARVRVTEPGAWPLRRTHMDLPAPITAARSFKSVMAANLGLEREWRGRIYLFDAVRVSSLEQSLHFLDTLVEHITPALTNVFLLRRLRTRVTAAERARVARDLHDGAIQALFGIEMKIEALRRGKASLSPPVNAELEDIQELLRREVLALRELMQALRPIELDASDQLPDVLASVVERFRRDTGVSARFVFTGESVIVPPATALEIVRIVQEALVNVRKHSRARNVLVRLTGYPQRCTLVVEDDGIGFEFGGRVSAEDLERRRIGPTIIKERATIAGASLAIDSVPGEGARLELTFESSHG